MYLVCAHPVWIISPFGSFNFLLSLFGNMEIAVLDCSCPMCFLALQWLSLSRYILVPSILVLALHSPTLLSPNDLHLNINFRMAKPSEGAAQAAVGPGWYLEDSEYITFKVHSPETKGSLHHFTIFFYTNLTIPVHEGQAKQLGCTPPRQLRQKYYVKHLGLRGAAHSWCCNHKVCDSRGNQAMGPECSLSSIAVA